MSDKINLWCCICKNRTSHIIGYSGVMCQDCDFFRTEMTPCEIVSHYKKINSLTWEEFGKQLGYTGNTIRHLFWSYPKRITIRMLERDLIGSSSKEKEVLES